MQYFFALFLFVLLTIPAHHNQYTLRNNNIDLQYNSIYSEKNSRGAFSTKWCKYIWFFQSLFLGSKLVHCIHKEISHISWKFYSKIFHTEWFIEARPFLWILPMSDESNNYYMNMSNRTSSHTLFIAKQIYVWARLSLLKSTSLPFMFNFIYKSFMKLLALFVILT